MKKRLMYIFMIMLLMVGSIPGTALAKTDQAASTAQKTGRFTDDTKEVSHKITLKKSGRLTISIQSEVNLSLVIYENEISSAGYLYYEPIDKGNDKLIVDLIQGTYVLRYSANDTGKFSYSTSLVSANETYTYDNNSINLVRNKSSIPFSQKINGQLAENDDEDYYKIVLPEAGRLDLDVDSKLDSNEIALFYATGVNDFYYLGRVGKGNSHFFYDLSAGTYYLRFSKWDDTGNYSFKANYESAKETYKGENNTINAVRKSASIPMSQIINGQLAENDDCDYYKLTIDKTGKYAIKVDSRIESMDVELYDSTESGVYDTNRKSYHNHTSGLNTYNYSLKKGTYYLEFSNNYNKNTGNYSFCIEKIVVVSRPKINVAKGGKKRIKLKWKTVDCDGYEIVCATNKSFTKNARKLNIANGSASSKTIKKLKAKKNYYLKIRAYAYDKGEKKFSKWSNVRKVRTKK